jgi:hypothetical protein
VVLSQPRQIVHETLSQKKKKITKNGWWSGLRCRPWVQTPVPKKKKHVCEKYARNSLLLLLSPPTPALSLGPSPGEWRREASHPSLVSCDYWFTGGQALPYPCHSHTVDKDQNNSRRWVQFFARQHYF